MMKCFLVSLFLFLTANPFVFAQDPADEQLAFQYLQEKDYEKAILYFEKLFKKKPGLDYYNPYLLCLTRLEQYNDAEKLIKKMMRMFPKDPILLIDMGTLYKDMGQTGKGEAQYEKAIKLLVPSQVQILNLAEQFIQLHEWDYAIESYRHGKRIMKGYYPFTAEIASVYGQKGDIGAMVSEYLSLLEEGAHQMQTVQNGLQPSFGETADEERNDIIKSEILKKVQEHPEITSYNELLIWFFIQEKNFKAAFVHSKALDKRLSETGGRILNLGMLAVSNEDYTTGAKCFEYILSKGKENSLYVPARMEMINARFKKITLQNDYTTDDLSQLEKIFTDALTELGKTTQTAALMKNLAHLQGLYLMKINEAIDVLKEAIAIPGINAGLQAECKLDLGDIYLMTGKNWDASLLYSQVALDFKHEPVGFEAKFRNARVSYFNGEFAWAQAQLDVLKGATQKLTSNDAMYLSILISDNSHEGGDDSLALLAFSQAELLNFRNQPEKALAAFDSLLVQFPFTSLADDILFRKYKIYLKNGKVNEAAMCLETLIEKYGSDILGDDALFYLAELKETKLGDEAKAKMLYEQLLTSHPGSLFTVEARKRYRRLRGDQVN